MLGIRMEKDQQQADGNTLNLALDVEQPMPKRT